MTVIIYYQHIFPVMAYREEAQRQRDRIKKAFSGSLYPYAIVSCQFQDEKETLQRLQWDAYKEGAAFYAYIHLKGITHPGDSFVDDWREMMEYFTIDCWRRCREELERGADAVGCNYQVEPFRHFSGNFFMVRQASVASLKPVMTCASAEEWIGSSKRADYAMKSLHDSCTNHYAGPYRPEMYR